MLALGSCIAGTGLLVTGLLALLFRHPNAPRWTRPEAVAMLACVPVAVTTGLGLGYTGYGLSRLAKGDGNPLELVVLAAVVVTLILVWRALRIRQRLKDYAIAAGGSSPSVAVMEPTILVDAPPPAPRPRAPRSGRKAA